ncbi:MAG TPA: sigma-70 family RNA polymerase sigma factor [Bacteroidota bacterium]|nr:sigma-70 family RNA polymerase sigma factor [Bacteroidota bacterium]
MTRGHEVLSATQLRDVSIQGRNGQGTGRNVDDRSDEILVTLFQQGDEGAFRVLVERYQEKIRNLIYSIFNEPELVDDLAQEVFIKAYEGLANFRFQSSLYTWLYRIAVNRSRDEMRKRKLRKWLSLHTMMESGDTEFQQKMTTQPVSSDTEEIVSKGLQQLPEKFRIAVILKDIEGLSYEEMAEVMQCEIGTVKSRLSRARSMLRKVVKPLLEEAQA